MAIVDWCWRAAWFIWMFLVLAAQYKENNATHIMRANVTKMRTRVTNTIGTSVTKTKNKHHTILSLCHGRSFFVVDIFNK